MLALMFLLHFFADFNLQIGSGMDKFKQRKWWSDQLPNNTVERDRYLIFKKYRYDYLCGLVCHGLYWSLIVCLPILLAGGFWYALNSLAHGAIHVFVDDAKANRMKLNLWQDQAIHALQVLLVWFVWMFIR